jgi:hypothetical protein
MSAGSGRADAVCRQNARLSGRLEALRVLAKPPAARYQVRDRFRALPGRAAWSAAIAQLVEHVIRNDGVGGSNPSCGTGCSRGVWARSKLERICPDIFGEFTPRQHCPTENLSGFRPYFFAAGIQR